ncbi:BrnA antitoxin family protein [Campylobacter insulaenigrae]|uniref:BrnA antitoxin family protein n=1 Tax=Campylobacter insulaenigrae TaxID=260714 RepID=UPI0021539488|nr:BrnA antitoxin family protein [Campylobacter insulaenigrae]MCR6570396.1 BrnA antitoxin family protein [Campylobacter insulaenigrae]MCR6582872.1 BrnA antitoxin family protein [Campylobacter insulaenigrae]MCR6587177.1 BrnA antitoxin family protein [Campylobacter insulaenigrae]
MKSNYKRKNNTRIKNEKKEIDFKNAIRNPYVNKESKRQITINLNGNVIDYFKEMAKKKGVPYQILINIFLNDCVNKKLDIAVVE